MVDALPLGPHRIWPPVVLAPMAGVTNRVFRTLCAGFGGGLYVAEMVSARALAFGDRKSWDGYVDFDPGERIRSLQLYATDPADVAEATRRLVGEGRVDHLDLNSAAPPPRSPGRGAGRPSRSSPTCCGPSSPPRWPTPATSRCR